MPDAAGDSFSDWVNGAGGELMDSRASLRAREQIEDAMWSAVFEEERGDSADHTGDTKAASSGNQDLKAATPQLHGVASRRDSGRSVLSNVTSSDTTSQQQRDQQERKEFLRRADLSDDGSPDPEGLNDEDISLLSQGQGRFTHPTPTPASGGGERRRARRKHRQAAPAGGRERASNASDSDLNPQQQQQQGPVRTTDATLQSEPHSLQNEENRERNRGESVCLGREEGGGSEGEGGSRGPASLRQAEKEIWATLGKQEGGSGGDEDAASLASSSSMANSVGARAMPYHV
jgi:hypothetical protein